MAYIVANKHYSFFYRQNDSDPDWEPDTEVLAEVHVEIDDPE